jgi:hypothetical protein
MDAARKIRESVGAVEQLRRSAQRQPGLASRIGEVKRLQSRRFAGTYADLLRDPVYGAASRFFLDELYSDKDFEERDQQFARIAGAIERLFPEQVADTAASLAQLHALTEDLDQSMARFWLEEDGASAASRYVRAWRQVGRRAEREQQLAVVIRVGHELSRFTRTPGLRMMLRMMRGPAGAAGLGSLQQFLEGGFDTFAAMAKRRGAAETFLQTIEQREQGLIGRLFDADPVAGETELATFLGQAR